MRGTMTNNPQQIAVTPEGFYAYVWMRNDGTPYYVGKGKRRRGFIVDKHLVPGPKDPSMVVVMPMGSEEEALRWEKALIALFGRKDQGTGCLHNLTAGGIGQIEPSEETRRKMREAKLGRSPWNKGLPFSAETRRKMSETRIRNASPTCPRGHTRFKQKGDGRPHRRCLDCHREQSLLRSRTKRMQSSDRTAIIP
jgi:NUMOD3 motif